MELHEYDLVAFDVAGTTVHDDGVVLRAFQRAFEESEPEHWKERRLQWLEYASETMGRSKIEVFTEILGDRTRAERATEIFEESYLQEIAGGGIVPIPGTEDLFYHLHDAGVAIGLTTGFSPPVLDAILVALDWLPLVDCVATPAEAGRGRPAPDMLQLLASKISLSDPKRVVVVGDTQADMEAGIAFGAAEVIGVRTGAHKDVKLVAAGATRVVNSVADLHP